MVTTIEKDESTSPKSWWNAQLTDAIFAILEIIPEPDTERSIGDLDIVLLRIVRLDQVKVVVINVRELVLDTADVGDVHIVGGWAEILELLSGEDIKGDQVDLGVSVLSRLGGGHLDDLARTALDDDVPVEEQLSSAISCLSRRQPTSQTKRSILVMEKVEIHTRSYAEQSTAWGKWWTRRQRPTRRCDSRATSHRTIISAKKFHQHSMRLNPNLRIWLRHRSIGPTLYASPVRDCVRERKGFVDGGGRG